MPATDVDLFAGVPVTDFPRAIAWYERLFGRAGDFAPHDTETVWTLAEHGHVYVVLDPARAGHALVTVFRTDHDDFVAAASARGLEPISCETYTNGVRKTTYRDPDGNELSIGGAPTPT